MGRGRGLFASFFTLMTAAQNVSFGDRSRAKDHLPNCPVCLNLLNICTFRELQRSKRYCAQIRARSPRLVGGNPVRANAAVQAVGKWKFAPADSETTEVVPVSLELS